MKNEDLLWRNEIVENSIFRIDESYRMIQKSLERLQEDDVWKRPNDSSNSIGNLLLHLCGNITQYLISSLGGQPDVRRREQEFSALGGPSKAELLDQFQHVIDQAKEVLSRTNPKEFLRIREVQGYTMSGIGIVIHAVEHLSYHTGQIAYWTKILKNIDLGFYDGIDLNIKNN